MSNKAILPVLAGGAAVLALSGGKKSKSKGKSSGGVSRWGVKISKDCKKISIFNEKLFLRFINGAYIEALKIDDSFSLLQIADIIFDDVAPNCSGFPEEPESPNVAELYFIILTIVWRIMVEESDYSISDEDLIEPNTAANFSEWYLENTNPKSPEIFEFPADQVAFSGDMDRYKIGKEWYKYNIVPFVRSARINDRLDSAFNDYVLTRNVKVGMFVRPISTLPENEPSVIHFLKKLSDSIDKAKSELS